MESDNDLRNADDRVGADFALQHFWPGCNDQTSDWVGLNVLLVVLRHLGSFIPHESRSNEMTQRDEDQNPILKLVWQKIHGKTPLEGEMTLRRKVSEVFMQGGTNHPTFKDLLTHPLMKETLLSSPGYQLFRQQSWVLNPGPPRVWQLGRLFDDKEISQATPFLWDGKRPLGEVLATRFSPFRDPNAPDSGRLLLHMFAQPRFMFINYQKEDNENRREFSSLQTLNFEGSEFVLQGNGQGYALAHTEVAYTLVAVVFQSNGASNDFVRLYGLDGGYILPPSRAQDIVTLDQWSVTSDLGRFMLVYAKDTADRPIEFSRETGPGHDIFNDLGETDYVGAGLLGYPEFDSPFMYSYPKQSSHAAPSRQSSAVDSTVSMSSAPQSTRSASIDKSDTRPSQSTAIGRGRGPTRATSRAGELQSQQGSNLSRQTTTQSFLNAPTTAIASMEVPTTQSNTSAPSAPSQDPADYMFTLLFGDADGDPSESSDKEEEEFDEDMPDRSIDETDNYSRPGPHQFQVHESRQGQILPYPDQYSSQSHMGSEPAGSQWTGLGSNRGRTRGNNGRRGSGDHYDSYGGFYGGTEDDYHHRGGTYRGGSRGNRDGHDHWVSYPNTIALGSRRGGRQ